MESVSLEMSIQKQRNHSGLPVIAVQYVRLEIHEISHEIQNSSLVETITLNIKNIININLIKVKVILVINKIERYSVLLKREQTGIKRTPAHMNHLPAEELQFISILNLDFLIQRKNYSAIDTLSVEFNRKTANNVCKSANLNKRAALGSCH